MAEQRAENEKKKQEDLKTQYEKEQDLYNNRALLSTESKDKLELNFMYEAPPGAKRERQKEDDEPEYKFEWQRKYNAPREDYAKGNADIRDQPFGIPVRNVRCIKCHKWGHINTDKDCPLYSHASTSSMPTTSMDPLELMRQMRDDGYNLKQSVLGHHLDPKHSNQQFIPSDESDPEMDFLKSLSSKQKRKLLKKLNKLSKKQKKKSEIGKKKKSKKNKKEKKRAAEISASDDESSEDESYIKKSKAKSESTADSQSSEDGEEEKQRSKKKKSLPSSSKSAKQESKKLRKESPDESTSEDDSDDNAKVKKRKKKDKRKDKADYVVKRTEEHHSKGKRKKDESDSSEPLECSPPKLSKNSECKGKKRNEERLEAKESVSKESSRKTGKHENRKKDKEGEKPSPRKDTKDSANRSQLCVEKEKCRSTKDVGSTSKQQKSEDGYHSQSSSKKEKSSTTTAYTSSEDSSNASGEKADRKVKDKSGGKVAEVGDDASQAKASPLHPDGFDHENPQHPEDENKMKKPVEKYHGLTHDKYRNLHRHRRSPSVKQKYRP